MPAGDNTQPAMAYPTKRQYARWKKRAGHLDMSVSEFIQAMVEAGMKAERGFEWSIDHDESRRELRAQRNAMRDELDQCRERIADLEEQVHQGERAVINQYVERHPGATYGELVQHVIDTVPERVVRHLEDLEGEVVVVTDEGLFYPNGEARKDG